MSLSFQQAYDQWIMKHVENSSAERKRRLAEGVQEAVRLFLELAWWPVFHSLEGLYPKYEVIDLDGRTRFLDLAYIRPPFAVDLEIDGFGPHARDISRWRFADDLMRQNRLVLDGWYVLRFAYDDIREKSRRCQQILRDLRGIVFSHDENWDLSLYEREIIRKAAMLQETITVDWTMHVLEKGDRKARACLASLKDKGWLLQTKGGNQRTHGYVLNKERSWRR